MLRLVQANLAASGKPDPGDRSPPLLLDGGASYAFVGQQRHLGLERSSDMK